MSTQEGNKFYQGNYYSTAKQDSLATFVDSLRDFRRVVSFEKVDSDRNFVQIEGISYIMSPNKKDAKKMDLRPWEGMNGICETNLKISLPEISDVVLCLFERKLYLKFYSVTSKEMPITREIKLSEDVALAVQDSSNQVTHILSCGVRSEHILFIYKQKGKLCYLMAQISGDLNSNMQLSSKGTFPEFDDSNSELGDKSKFYHTSNLMDAEMADDHLVMMIVRNGSSRFLKYTTSSNFKLALSSVLILPAHVNFITKKKMVPLVEETKIDNEAVSKLEKGLTHTWISVLVKVKITDPLTKLDKTSTQVLVLDPRSLNINALSLLEVPAGYDVLEVG